MACRGAVDQHSLLQQVIEGATKQDDLDFQQKPSTSSFFRSPENLFPELEILKEQGLEQVLEAEIQATYQALVESEVSVLQIEVDSIRSESLAAVFQVFELLIGCLGEVLDINAFDQPGVELGKQIAKEILRG